MTLVSSYVYLAELDSLTAFQLQGQMFKIPFLAYWAVVVCSPKVIDEIKNGKDDELSFHEVYHGSYRWPPDYPKSREDSV